MAQLYKVSEWQSGRNWYVANTSDLANDSNSWWIPARFLNLSLEDYILKLVNEYNVIIDGFYPDMKEGRSVLLYHWDNYNDAHRFLLWINRMARNGKWTIQLKLLKIFLIYKYNSSRGGGFTMSRSYKHTDFVKDPNNKFMKRFANKKVRHSKDIPSGGAYKKVFCSWEISDYRWRWTREEAIEEWYEHHRDPDNPRNRWFVKKFETLEKYLIYWEKCTKRK